jgi:hypothetical protein
MRASELAMTMVGMIKDVEKTALDSIRTLYQPDQEDSNSITDVKAVIHRGMETYVVLTSLQAWAAAQRTAALQKLESDCMELGITTDPVAGTTTVIYSDHDYSFGKKQNNNSTAVDAKAFLVELHKLGVDKDIIDKAKKNATVDKKGAVYITVTGVD